jgi:penicillin-binding protein 1A
MRKATGGTLPARIFHVFMSEAEETMPVRPLAGANVMAAAQLPDMLDQPPPPPENEKSEPDALQKLLNGIFGGT